MNDSARLGGQSRPIGYAPKHSHRGGHRAAFQGVDHMHVNSRWIATIGVLLLLIYSIDSVAQTTTRTRRLTVPPSNELTNDPITTARFGLLCYDLFTGALVDTCRVEFELRGVGGSGITVDCVPDANGDITVFSCGNGGHTHGPPDFPNNPRPITLNDTPLMYPGDELTSPGEEFIAAGFSPLSQNTAFTWDVPQVAGIYEFNAKLTATPGYAFFWIPNKITTIETLGTLRATQARTAYRQFPDNPAEWARIRGGRNQGDPVGSDPDHTDSVAFGAAEITHQVLPLIAAEYAKLRPGNRRLSINDISLPMGGVFDDNQDWTRPHAEHRNGRDVDLNQDGLPCQADTHLRAAVNKFLVKLATNSNGQPRNPPSALLCESGGRKHIDVTWLVTSPII